MENTLLSCTTQQSVPVQKTAPELFSRFYSNEKAKQTLASFIADGRLPHALLLEGPAGCGKTFFARLVACAALCSKQPCPCGVCRTCRLVLSDTHPDVLVLSPDSPEKPYAIKALRETILSCYVLPNDGDKKVYIFRDIHQMSEQAQNALLKIIEEPPPHVLFVLTCTNRARVLPTILSRVTPIILTSCSPQQCAQALQERLPEADPQDLLRAAFSCDGCIGRALQILTDETLSQVYRISRRAAELICLGDEFELLCLLQPVAKKKETLLSLLGDLEEFFAEVIRFHTNARPTAGETNFIPESITNRVTTLQAAQIIDIIRAVQSEVNQNVSPALACAQLCGQCKQLLQ